MRKKIAITGGIGSGKSLLLDFARELGYKAFSCDEIYKDLLEKEFYIQSIQRQFPIAVENGKINKMKLSEIVFNDKEKLKQLNKIAHPFILQELEKQMNESLKKTSLVFAEVPVLFENGYEENFDEILVVLRDKNQRIESLKKRDFSSVEEIKNKMNSQFDYDHNLPDIKNENVHFLYNNNKEENLKTEFIKMLDILQ